MRRRASLVTLPLALKIIRGIKQRSAVSRKRAEAFGNRSTEEAGYKHGESTARQELGKLEPCQGRFMESAAALDIALASSFASKYRNGKALPSRVMLYERCS